MAKVTREDVCSAYRLFLGREPENEAAIQHFLGAPDLEALRKVFLTSTEFRNKIGKYGPIRGLPMTAPPLDVEVEASPAVLARMVAKMAAYWEKIGRQAPHWSVLVGDRFSPQNIEANLEAFFASAILDEQIMLSSLARAGFKPSDFKTCVEFGCGVGRLTIRLASLFQFVKAVDISAPHLELAQNYCRKLNLSNIEFARADFDNLMPITGFDFWFSRLVLQHNPPPVSMEILKRAFRALSVGGVAMFQVPVYALGYQFNAEAYLQASPGKDMEVHFLPQKSILDAAEFSGLRLLDLREDTWVIGGSAGLLSNSFVFLKTRSSHPAV
jgi:SAM-dependent methyltransferase